MRPTQSHSARVRHVHQLGAGRQLPDFVSLLRRQRAFVGQLQFVRSLLRQRQDLAQFSHESSDA